MVRLYVYVCVHERMCTCACGYMCMCVHIQYILHMCVRVCVWCGVGEHVCMSVFVSPTPRFVLIILL